MRPDERQHNIKAVFLHNYQRTPLTLNLDCAATSIMVVHGITWDRQVTGT
jgi:hypothetical protein